MLERIVFEDDEIVVVHRPGRSDFTLVTFAAIGHAPNGTWFWAAPAAQKLDLEAVGVIARRRKWYPAASMGRAAAALRALLRPQSIGYGYSMGGYAVLKHGALLGLTHGLAVAPQVSVDPADVPQDRRFHHHHEPALHAGMRVAPGDGPPVCFVAADPYWTPDAIHLDWAVRVIGAVPIRLPFLRHAVISRFTSSARLAQLCGCVLRGDADAIRATLRQGRGSSAETRVWLGREAEARGHPAMAAAMWRRAADLGAPADFIEAARATALRWRLAALLEAGRGTDARAIATETIALQPPNGLMLRWVGRLLLRGGQPEMARLAFERMLRAQPGNADGWLGLVEALHRQGAPAAMGQAAAAARDALAHDPGAAPALARIGRLVAARGLQGAANIPSGA